MYQSALIYPGNPGKEKVFMTQSVKNRLAHIKTDMKRCGFGSYADAARQTGIVAETWRNVCNGMSLSLKIYMDLAKALRWDISRDANYHYAEALHLPAELQRRIERLFPEGNNYYMGCRYIDNELKLQRDATWQNMHYAPARNSQTFARILLWISDAEKQRNFHDALGLEH